MNWILVRNASESSLTNWTVLPDVEDPRILASSYTMYKIGEFVYFSTKKHKKHKTKMIVLISKFISYN